MQGGNQISEALVGSGGFGILGNNLSAAGNITINAGQTSEKKCLQALFVTDPADDRAKHISFKGDPVRSIFTWITDVDAYKSWVDRATGSRLLWISGGPGMGKTMLAIFLSEELEQIAKNSGLVLYYFCEGGDLKRNCPANILRGLIYTLVQQRPALMKHLLPDYEVRADALFGPDAIEPLWRILINMVKDPATGAVYCIIDGIDECAPTSLRHLEHMLKKITSFYRFQKMRRPDGEDQKEFSEETSSPKNAPSQQNGSRVTPLNTGLVFKVALISREEPQCLPRELSEFERVRLRKPEQIPIPTELPMNSDVGDSNLPLPVSATPGSDSLPSSTTHPDSQESSGYAVSLELYIKEKVDTLVSSKGFDEDYGDLLKQQLATRGDGTFLWVDTAVDQLGENASKHSSLDLLSLPGRTDGLYCLGLLEAPQGMAMTIAFVLRWVTVAFRPLKISELSAVMYFVNDQPNGPEIEDVRNAIVLCRSLLDVSRNGEVKLAHQSTKAFLTEPNTPLLRDARTQQFHVDEEKTHAEIANISISYVEHSPFHQGWWHLAPIDIGTTSEVAVGPDPDLLAQYPFIQYSSLYWPNHLTRSPQGMVNLRSPLFSPGSEIRRHWFQSVWEIIRCRDGSETPLYMSLLHIAAFFDLQELAQVLSRREHPGRFRYRMEKMNSELMTPLFTAADRGSPRVFTFLLDHGASQNWSASGEDILQFTSRRGRLELVKILISRGANPNHFLSESFGIKTASLVLRHAPRKLKNYVINAGYQEDQDINELIKVDHGANMSPLQCAVCCGHQEVAQVLLECGANVHYTTTTGWTTMHFAAWAGQRSLIQLIQRYTGNLSALSNGGWSALHCAAWRGRTSAGDYLMNQGIHTDLYSRDMQTPLHLAAFQGHDEMVSSLLSWGSNAEARTNKGLTPLHLAAAEGHDLAVQVLLDHGANRDATSNRGESAFTLAMNSQKNTTAQLLQTYRPQPHIHDFPSAVSPVASEGPSISRVGDHPSYVTMPIPDLTSAHCRLNEAGTSGPTHPRPICRKALSSTSPGVTVASNNHGLVPKSATEISQSQITSLSPPQSRESRTCPVVQPLQQFSEDQHITSRDSGTVGSPQKKDIIQSHPFPVSQRARTPVTGLMRQPTSRAPQNNNTPPPLPPRPPRLSENLQQVPRCSYQQYNLSIQPQYQNDPQQQFLQTQDMQQSGPSLPQYSHPSNYDGRSEPGLEHSSAGQAQQTNTPANMSSTAGKRDRLLQGLLSRFKM